MIKAFAFVCACFFVAVLAIWFFSHTGSPDVRPVTETDRQLAMDILSKETVDQNHSLTACQIAKQAFVEYSTSYAYQNVGREIEVVFSGFAKTNSEGTASKRAFLSFVVDLERESVHLGTAAGNLDWSMYLD